VGVRVKGSNKLVAFISGIPASIQVRGAGLYGVLAVQHPWCCIVQLLRRTSACSVAKNTSQRTGACWLDVGSITSSAAGFAVQLVRRVKGSNKLVAFISGIPASVQVRAGGLLAVTWQQRRDMQCSWCGVLAQVHEGHASQRTGAWCRGCMGACSTAAVAAAVQRLRRTNASTAVKV
jgi:hypothetical protein